jgi:hypothetical protein
MDLLKETWHRSRESAKEGQVWTRQIFKFKFQAQVVEGCQRFLILVSTLLNQKEIHNLFTTSSLQLIRIISFQNQRLLITEAQLTEELQLPCNSKLTSSESLTLLLMPLLPWATPRLKVTSPPEEPFTDNSTLNLSSKIQGPPLSTQTLATLTTTSECPKATCSRTNWTRTPLITARVFRSCRTCKTAGKRRSGRSRVPTRRATKITPSCPRLATRQPREASTTTQTGKLQATGSLEAGESIKP